jgi:hypothetical protein
MDFDDEFEFLVRGDAGIPAWLGVKPLTEFERRVNAEVRARDEARHVQRLREKLAIDPDGNHIAGAVGTVQVGVRPIRRRLFEVETLDSIRRRKRLKLPLHRAERRDREMHWRLGTERWPVFAGEAEERIAGNPNLPEIPEDAFPTRPDGRLPPGIGATNPNISAESAVAALDAIVDRLDEGDAAASIRGRTGAQPADPDATETGTLLFTLPMSDPAFGAAADDAPGALATAAAITDDSSADATGTLGYCRAGATGAGADDHIDGSAGTSDADFVFNTLSIVSGAVVSMSSFTVSLPQGATAL